MNNWKVEKKLSTLLESGVYEPLTKDPTYEYLLQHNNFIFYMQNIWSIFNLFQPAEKFQIFGNDSNKSKFHSRENKDQTDFG
jgi:hypothetical protein